MNLLGRVKTAAALKVRAVEDWWFDRSRHVDTAGDRVPHRATDTAGSSLDGFVYGPARAHNVRSAIQSSRITDPAQYTFVDLGSGKGRVLFIAAELPFKRVIGVEYSAAMHKAAEANLRSLRGRGARSPIELVHGDAGSFEFPSGNFVLYMFNPFGPETLGCVMRNVQEALRSEPRHVVVILLFPEQAHVVAATPGLSIARRTRRFEIYEGGRPTPG